MSLNAVARRLARFYRHHRLLCWYVTTAIVFFAVGGFLGFVVKIGSEGGP